MIWGGATEWTITQSGTWTVPKTGRYMLELYANGGYGGVVSPYSVTGGSSCQRYNSIQLTKGDVYVVTVAPYGSGNTSFGSDYSVSTADNSTSETDLGSGTGNLGTVGRIDFSGSSTTKNPSSGTLGQSYGFGAVTSGNQGRGAVFLRYLGA